MWTQYVVINQQLTLHPSKRSMSRLHRKLDFEIHLPLYTD